MPTKVKSVVDQQELLDRIAGYADSARRSAAKAGDANADAVHISLGFVQAQINRYWELSRVKGP